MKLIEVEQQHYYLYFALIQENGDWPNFKWHLFEFKDLYVWKETKICCLIKHLFEIFGCTQGESRIWK